ncbi:Transient receptor putative cation channel sub A member 1 [Bulinus truncatus]|nr:Transient receptor putative cation channel sub A member 1 [Bulinus truncatus]
MWCQLLVQVLPAWCQLLVRVLPAWCQLLVQFGQCGASCRFGLADMVQAARLKAVTGKTPLESQETVKEEGFKAPEYSIQSGNAKFEFCLLRGGPYWIHKCAQIGDAKEVARIIKTDPTRLRAKNKLGKTALHLAAQFDQIEVVAVLISFRADLNTPDNDGNTALHLAVKCDSPETVSLLVQNGANPKIRNNLQMMPMHVAADLNYTEVIEVLLDNGVDPMWTGENGMTALHYAAAKDNGDAIRALMQRGANPGVTDAYGHYPIHTAANSAASTAMAAIFEEAIMTGWTSNRILNLKDRENNLPLHSAVNGGDIKAVKVCLSAGASLKAQQEDGSTPLHFACAMGNLEMIKVMKELRKNDFLAAISALDAMKMTPLHRAALFNHTQIMQYLIEHGADMDCRDISSKTPLLLAVSKSCWAAAQLLVTKGADIYIKDKRNRNFIHIAIKRGGKLDQTVTTLAKQDVMYLQNDKDDYGCTALHYAAKKGHLSAVDDLLKMGSIATTKNKEGQSPFHFAARYGRYTTCCRLLSSPYGPHLLNESDGEGLTALHIAAQNGHARIVQLLLQRGAVVNRDHNDNTALHHASVNGWTSTLRTILSVHSNLIDAVNTEGDSPLHLAAKNGHTSAVLYLLTMGAKIMYNTQHEAFFDCIVEHSYSEVAVAVINHERWDEILQACSRIYGSFLLGLIEHLPAVCMNVLDRCQTLSDDDPRSPNFHVVRFIRQHYDFNLDVNSTKRKLYGNSYGGYTFATADYFNIWIIFLYNILNMLKEFIQMYAMKRPYFADIGNAFEWFLYVTSVIFVVPFFLNKSFHWQWEAGALAVFLAWFNCLVFLQRFDFFGIYVVMFLEILRTLVQVLCVFSILIIAFGLSLFMLMSREESKAHSTPMLSMLRTFMMMLELDYIASFNLGYTDSRDDTIHFGPLTLIMLTTFVLLMPILLMNLLIGLAVGDIESVQRDARLKRLAMQVDIHINIERKMPLFVLEKMTLDEYKHYPNRYYRKIVNIFFRILSTKLEEDSKCLEASAQSALVFEELYRQKSKLKDMGSVMEKNHQMLRQVLKKMGMKSEDEEWDEGEKLNSDDSEDETEITQAKKKSAKENQKSAAVGYTGKGSRSSDV